MGIGFIYSFILKVDVHQNETREHLLAFFHTLCVVDFSARSISAFLQGAALVGTLQNNNMVVDVGAEL